LVIDTSALLAILFNEPLSTWAAGHLQRSQAPRMSTINYAEALIVSGERFPQRLGAVEAAIQRSAIQLIAPTARQAEIAAVARLRYPLNLGDCFAYALAKDEDCPLLTLDRDFRRCDIDVVLPRAN
jgi:ribonuclease VapC